MMAATAIILRVILGTGSAQAQNWPDVFDPNEFLTLNITMTQADWNTIRYDLTFNIEKQAQFWADGEAAIIVSVRRKSCDALPNEFDPNKISLKIDINEYFASQEWHGLRKLSLENGDDVDVLAEGLACNLHKMASGPEGYNYDAWRANWVKLYVNGVYRGVYVNAENVDRKFLLNRGLDHPSNWLYKYIDLGNFELKVGNDLSPASPAVQAICYLPFAHANPGSLLYPSGGLCLIPDDANVAADMNDWVNMQGMLTYAAVNAFVANPDDLFNYGGHNTYFYDFSDGSGRKRRYYPWDMDQAMQNTVADIYEKASGDPTGYQDVILGNPVFRRWYNRIMKDLLNGPLSEANIHAFLDDINTPELQAAIAADLYNQIGGDVPAKIAALKTWISDRIENVIAQVERDEANLDGLGCVNFKDVAILVGDWRQTGPDLAGDVNRDEVVNTWDLAQMHNYWLTE